MPIHDQEVTPSVGGEGSNDENGENDEHKSGQVQNYPRPQGIADSWYKNLKTSLKELEKVFSDRLPSEENAASAPVVEKTRAEYEREILETKLTVEMLGKTKTVEGREVDMHVAWAEEMERLVLQAKLESGTMYMREVREGLPGIIRDGLPVGEEYESWMGFLDAVKGISATYIREKTEGT